MTSNIGSHLIQDAFDNAGTNDLEKVAETARVEVMNLLKQTVRPEFLNRVDEIIMFQPLKKKEVRRIIEIQLSNLKRLVKESNIELEFSDYTLDFLVQNGYDPQFGARPLKRLIQKEIVNQLSKRILAGDIDKTSPVIVDVFDGVVVFRNDKVEKKPTSQTV